MPFWKKSEDPWDMEPGQPVSTMETPEQDGESLADTVKEWGEKIKTSVQREEEPEGPPETCPWCGKPMERGYLDAVKGGDIWWVTERPGKLKTALMGADPKTSLRVDDEGTLFTYKTAWYCAACRKMALDAAGMKRPYETSFDEIGKEKTE
ncbi:PF20097 family protein [uncultured Dysosmobacter sp.]|uniref:PF20097 family protein n=1 Tax=uncultured Dysosmobacter sp. TaxID=2591384 RepID=UPI002617D294|nr:PF20097 family protein [uncultured Dysosmobacter sp.]